MAQLNRPTQTASSSIAQLEAKLIAASGARILIRRICEGNPRGSTSLRSLSATNHAEVPAGSAGEDPRPVPPMPAPPFFSEDLRFNR